MKFSTILLNLNKNFERGLSCWKITNCYDIHLIFHRCDVLPAHNYHTHSRTVLRQGIDQIGHRPNWTPHKVRSIMGSSVDRMLFSWLDMVITFLKMSCHIIVCLYYFSTQIKGSMIFSNVHGYDTVNKYQNKKKIHLTSDFQSKKHIPNLKGYYFSFLGMASPWWYHNQFLY